MRNTVILIVAVIGIAAIITGAAHLPADNTLQRLELQAEAKTCRDALESGLPPLTTVYCEGVIREYSIMIKAYKKEQRQKLIERAQEKS